MCLLQSIAFLSDDDNIMKLISCTHADHAIAILEIFNEAIVNSTALYDYKPRLPEFMINWFNEKSAMNYPIIGALDDNGTLLGFASYGAFRSRPAYKYTIEHSVYVHKDHRGQGIASALMNALIGIARTQHYHVLVGGIDMDNTASIALHEKFGFTYAGTVREAGFKFGRWLDVGFYQLVLDTPASPMDG
jgi:phosphinothricin acetyltransferase